MDAGLQRGRRGRPGADVRAHRGRRGPRRGARRSACSARAPRSPTASRARAARRALRAAVPVHPGRGLRRRRATPCCPATSSPPRTAPGIVHTAIAFGEDDFRLGAEQGLAVVNPVRLDGTYDERIGPYAGRWVKDADPDLIEDLRARGRLLRAETLLHAYPHCWRCGTPLLYYAKPSWYIRTSALRDRLLAANETVTGTRRTSSTGASASGWRTTSTGRSRASATGARRCRSGAARTATSSALGSFAEVRGALGPRAARSAPARTSTSTPGRARSAAARCAACPR